MLKFSCEYRVLENACIMYNYKLEIRDGPVVYLVAERVIRQKQYCRRTGAVRQHPAQYFTELQEDTSIHRIISYNHNHVHIVWLSSSTWNNCILQFSTFYISFMNLQMTNENIFPEVFRPLLVAIKTQPRNVHVNCNVSKPSQSLYDWIHGKSVGEYLYLGTACRHGWTTHEHNADTDYKYQPSLTVLRDCIVL